jgi:hypothetical protein
MIETQMAYGVVKYNCPALGCQFMMFASQSIQPVELGSSKTTKEVKNV